MGGSKPKERSYKPSFNDDEEDEYEGEDDAVLYQANDNKTPRDEAKGDDKLEENDGNIGEENKNNDDNEEPENHQEDVEQSNDIENSNEMLEDQPNDDDKVEENEDTPGNEDGKG